MKLDINELGNNPQPCSQSDPATPFPKLRNSKIKQTNTAEITQVAAVPLLLPPISLHERLLKQIEK